MSKLLRSELKEIVKECLVEILSEGINSTSTSNFKINESNKNNGDRKRSSSHLDNIVYNKNVEQKKRAIKKNVMNSNITSDPILNELLADTAASTLQEQASAERGKNSSVIVQGDKAAKLAAESDPVDLFSKSAGKWAQLAFSK